jgi:5-methylthioadenosine/S-adenosylhomocysteine deaminase
LITDYGKEADMQEKVNILIKEGTVVTMDEGRRIIKDGAVALKKDKIADVGKSVDIEKKYDADSILNAKGKLVLPGLIGPHVHLVESFPRGFLDDMAWGLTGTKSVMERLWPYKLAMGREDVYYSSLLANLEMIKGGMTCFCEPAAHPEFYDEHFRATEESGIRGAIARSNIMLSTPGYPVADGMIDTPDEAIKKTLSIIEKWQGRGEGRLRPWLGVRHIFSTTEPFLMKTSEQHRKLSKSLGYRIGIKAHAAYSQGGSEDVIKRTGKREIEWLDSLGVLGPHWLLAHARLLSDNEVDIIKKHDVKIVHCVSPSLHCGSGVGRGKFLDMLKKGVTVSIAPDAAWCNNNLDMFLEMRHVAFVHKDATLDGSVLPAETALEMATLHGAKAMLWDDEIGCLKPGMKADVITVDPWKANSVPLHDHSIVKNLVYAIYSNQVDTVICNGKIIMEKREVKTLDEKDILKRSQELAEGVIARHPIKLKSEWPIV